MSSRIGRHYEETVKWAQSMGDEMQTGGFHRLLHAFLEMEKSLELLTRCQAYQVRAYLLCAKPNPQQEALSLLQKGMKSSSLWLEAMIMLHWIMITRLKGIILLMEMREQAGVSLDLSQNIANTRKLIWPSFYLLMEAVFSLVDRVISSMNRYPLSPSFQPLLEQQILQLLHQLEELFRLVARKYDTLATFSNEAAATPESTLQKMRSTLYTSLQNLEGHSSPSAILSVVFKSQLKLALLSFKRYSDFERTTQTSIHVKSPLSAPWLNSEVFPAFHKTHKVIAKSKKWKK